MITERVLKDVLNELEYTDGRTKYKKHFIESNCDIIVDFKNKKIIYPKGIKYERATTLNFSENENFVVLECVTRLLDQGYKPEHIYLEAPVPGGRNDRNAGYSDILVMDNDGIPYMIIECKTTSQEKNDEFDVAWKKTLKSGGQLFNYFNTYRQAKYLVLYASDYQTCINQNYNLISLIDNEKYLEANPTLRSYKDVSDDNGSHTEYFEVWKKTYQYDVSTSGVFEKSIEPFHIGKKKFSSDDLRDVDFSSMQKKYHQYATILRQFNVSSKENAFDKLINLFLAKIVDETYNSTELKCNWKGAAYDNYFDLHDRLLELYKTGMKEFFDDDVTYIENKKIEDAFGFLVSKSDVAKETIYEYFKEMKYFNNNPFAILDVHNKELFYQNAVILKEVVRMLQDIKLKSNKQNQFLGDLFEGFLDQGVKQDEGQYFTPMPIVRFIISSLPLEKLINTSDDVPKAIDYACGAGHFLTEYASQIKSYAEKAKKVALEEYCKSIVGIEKEYRLSKVSQVSAYMYGLDGIQIRYNDALTHGINGVEDGSFSILIANPPYSVTGFLDTLDESEQQRYELIKHVPDISNNNSIELFFVERAKQLLKEDGVAAIILPSTVLSNDGIYAASREMILKYFNIIGITFLEGQTFGKTPTTTATLFLKRKKIEPDMATHFLNRVNEWFDGNFIDDEVYEDEDILEAYCQNVGFEIDDYKTLMRGIPNDELLDSQMFQVYWEYFNPATKAKAIKGINPDAKLIKRKMNDRYKKASFLNQTLQEQEEEIFDNFIAFVKAIEKEKLYYFALIKRNDSDVVVVKSPSASQAQKEFLGYEWSTSRGHEGIHYLNVTTDDTDENTINQIRGIEEIVTPLFDPKDLNSEKTINNCIRNNFLGKKVVVSEEIKKFISVISLEDMIDFSEISFTKQINLSAKRKFEVDSKYEQLPLSKIVQPLGGLWTGKKAPFVRVKVIRNTNFTMQGQMNLEDVAEIDVEKNAFDKRELSKGDIILEKSGGSATQAVGRVVYFDENEKGYSFSNFTARLRVTDNRFIPKYIYCYLNMAYQSGALIDYQNGMGGLKNLKMNKYLSIGVPCPTKTVQNTIISDCELLDAEFASTRMTPEKYSEKLIKIFKDRKVASIIQQD